VTVTTNARLSALRRGAVFLLQRQLAVGFVTWSAGWREATYRISAVRRLAASLGDRRFVRAFVFWRSVAAALIATAQLLRLRGVTRAFVFWRSRSAGRGYRLRTLRIRYKQNVHRLIAAYFATMRARYGRRDRCPLQPEYRSLPEKRAACRFFHASVARCWLLWNTFVQQRRRLCAPSHRVARRLLVGAWTRWSIVRRRRHSQRKTCTAAAKMRHWRLVRGLARWKDAHQALMALKSSPSPRSFAVASTDPFGLGMALGSDQANSSDASSPTSIEAGDVAELQRHIFHGLERRKALTSVLIGGRRSQGTPPSVHVRGNVVHVQPQSEARRVRPRASPRASENGRVLFRDAPSTR